MTFHGDLLPYQPYAVDAMVARKSMLVAYDLGLGKTVITIAAIEKLMSGPDRSPGLVIALSSLKYQWAESIHRFSDAKALVIDGTPKQRAAQYASVADYDYVILNYEQVVNDWKYISALPRSFVVLDEATAIKSFRSKRSKYTKRLKDAPVRFALTGTPIENGRPEELYSIMQFVDEKVLGRFDLFDKAFIVRNQFGAPERYRNLDVLHTKMKEASVRKSQNDPDVKPHLPETIYMPPIRVKLDRAGAGLYNHIVADLLVDLEEMQDMFGTNFNILSHYGYESDQGGPADELRGRIMSKITAMRMLCDHPGLLTKSAREYAAMSGTGSKYVYDLMQDGLLDGLSKTPKLDALVSYVEDFLDSDQNNKAVIFSVFVPTLSEICHRLSAYQPLKYSGQMSAKQKEASKVAFQTTPEHRLLVSSDAGGYGVDLPQANLLINYDLPWSSGTATQRNGRIRRASSGWEHVVIQDMVVAGSIEERQHDMLQQKSGVASAIIDGKGINDRGGVDLSVGSLRTFLTNRSV